MSQDSDICRCFHEPSLPPSCQNQANQFEKGHAPDGYGLLATYL
jgi:hypothetical protein